MITLGIETSCDETSCAVLNGKDQLLSNIISSSLFRHQPFGGVVPEIASRHCLEQIDIVFKEALAQAKIAPEKIDLIAVTEGPGLIGSLLVGISFAKSLSYQLKKPLVGVNHLDAHLAANFIGQKEPAKYIGLLVSGGHTSLSYHARGKGTLLGSTVDDAAGEAYDKVAKLLGLGYPGGPILDKLAQKGDPHAFRFTKPKQKGRFDFSFSGIKTAVLYETQRQLARHCELPTLKGCFAEGAKQSQLSIDKKCDCFVAPDGAPRNDIADTFVQDIAASFQKSVVSWLVEKTLDAAQTKKVKHIVAGGGVSANSELRKVLTDEGKKRGIEVHFPSLILTMDNAGMIARRGCELFQKGRRARLSLTGHANLRMGKTIF